MNLCAVVPLTGRKLHLARWPMTAAILAICSLAGALAQTRGNPAAATSDSARPSADDVCAFMSKEMAAAVPQVPTLCSPTGNDRYAGIRYEFSVFSPTDVLEGKMRRAWSSALFLTLQKLYLG